MVRPRRRRHIAVGSSVITSFGNIGTVEKMDKEVAEVLVGGIRLREKLANLQLAEPQQAETRPVGSLPRVGGTGVSSPHVSKGSSRGENNLGKPLDAPDAAAELNLIGHTTAEAEYELDRFIDEAYLASLPRIRIIHGYGTGALKNFVHHTLKNHDLIERFTFAPPDQGGNGADNGRTEAMICLKTRPTKFIFSCLIIVQSFAFAVDAIGQSDQDDNRWMLWENRVGTRWLMYHLEKTDVELLKAKWDEIGNSSEKNPSGFAGTYIVPAYMSGYFLRWSAEGGYIFVRFFDTEHPCYFSFGDVKATNSTVQFIHKGESNRSVCPPGNDGRPASEWVFVLDGEFLIPKAEIEDFANYYAGFNKFNGYHRQPESNIPFAIRWGREDKRVPGFVLPKDFSQFAKVPLTGQITGVGKTRMRKSQIFVFGDDYETVTPVTINVGRRHGLRLKQEFILLTDDDVNSETLLVTKVGTNQSQGVVIRKVTPEGKEGFFYWNSTSGKDEFRAFTQLRPGVKITTSPLSKI